MSIQSEITLLQNTKADLRNAIMEKGVVVTVNDPFAIYPTKISQISLTAGDRDALFTDILERDITSIDIPEGTSKIDEDVFRYCTQMTTVTIPSTVTSIGYQAFQYCSALQSITIFATTPPTVYTDAFQYTNDCPIYVPAASVTAYQTAWPQYADRIQAIPEVKFFTKITSLDEATSGKYLIVDTSVNKALNASLITNSTSTGGINAANNMIDVTIEDDTIAQDGNTLNAAADYDADNKTLSWTDSDTGTTYYLYWNGSGNRFAYSGNTSPSMQYTMEAKITYGNFTLGNSARSLGYTTTGPKFAFYPNGNESIFKDANIALFKLD